MDQQRLVPQRALAEPDRLAEWLHHARTAMDDAAAPFVFGKAPAKVAHAQERGRGAVVRVDTLRINREHVVIDRDRLREPCQGLQRRAPPPNRLDMARIDGEQLVIY